MLHTIIDYVYDYRISIEVLIEHCHKFCGGLPTHSEKKPLFFPLVVGGDPAGGESTNKPPFPPLPRLETSNVIVMLSFYV